MLNIEIDNRIDYYTTESFIIELGEVDGYKTLTILTNKLVSYALTKFNYYIELTSIVFNLSIRYSLGNFKGVIFDIGALGVLTASKA